MTEFFFVRLCFDSFHWEKFRECYLFSYFLKEIFQNCPMGYKMQDKGLGMKNLANPHFVMKRGENYKFLD